MGLRQLRSNRAEAGIDPEQHEQRQPHYAARRLPRAQSFQHAELVCDATVKFCDRFIDRRSRTHDQMVQTARSERQNIAEGSQASVTSKKFELKLVGVARASLEELLLDYEDFLRQRGLVLWGKDPPRSQQVRRLAYEENRSYMTYVSLSIFLLMVSNLVWYSFSSTPLTVPSR